MRLTLYGDPFASITFEELIKEQAANGDLWANAEESGSESCYVEVAKWCDETSQYCRYCFAKTMDTNRADYGIDEGESDAGVAKTLAGKINAAGYLNYPPIVSRMPLLPQFRS